MVESDLAVRKEKTQLTGIYTGDSESAFRREPSFSRWCVEDEVISPGHLLGNDGGASLDDPGFVLPLFQEGDLKSGSRDMERFGDHNEVKQRGSPMKSGHRTGADVNGHGARDDNYASFDIETNGLERDAEFLGIGDASSSNSSGDHGPSVKDSKNTIPVANVLKTLFFILVWYTLSTSLTLYNKILLGDDLGKFPAPLLMNTVHFAMQAFLSKAITRLCSQRFQASVNMSWWDYFERVVPTALGTALDINLSNASLVFISVTFATMCKSASPIFLLLFAFAFRLESPSIKLLGIISVISIGILLTVAKEAAFDFWGFIFVMLAAVMSGFRWSMTQILLQKEAYGLKNPLTLMSYVTPVMAIATALFSLVLDPWHEFKTNNYFNSSWNVTRSILLMFFGGTLAFCMVLTEYILISVTSAVTVTIAGVVKEAVTILVAVLYFHDKFTWLKGTGLLIIMVGVSLFNWYKYEKLKDDHAGEDDTVSTDVAPKYVILEEMDDPVDST